MHILLVNDDGIDSPQLALFCRAAAARGHRVSVIAPTYQQSAKAHSMTLSGPLMLHPARMEGADKAWSLEGTPVDCTRIGLLGGILDGRPDMVVSGINHGLNTGFATYVSGTVGAAREAAFLGVKALALSAAFEVPKETIAMFADFAVTVAERLAAYDLPPMTLCSVNCPGTDVSHLKGMRVCGINGNAYLGGYERSVTPRGVTVFWSGDEIDDPAPTPGRDIDLLNQGYITATFLAPEPIAQEQFADFPEGL